MAANRKPYDGNKDHFLLYDDSVKGEIDSAYHSQNEINLARDIVSKRYGSEKLQNREITAQAKDSCISLPINLTTPEETALKRSSNSDPASDTDEISIDVSYDEETEGSDNLWQTQLKTPVDPNTTLPIFTDFDRSGKMSTDPGRSSKISSDLDRSREIATRSSRHFNMTRDPDGSDKISTDPDRSRQASNPTKWYDDNDFRKEEIQKQSNSMANSVIGEQCHSNRSVVDDMKGNQEEAANFGSNENKENVWSSELAMGSGDISSEADLTWKNLTEEYERVRKELRCDPPIYLLNTHLRKGYKKIFIDVKKDFEREAVEYMQKLFPDLSQRNIFKIKGQNPGMLIAGGGLTAGKSDPGSLLHKIQSGMTLFASKIGENCSYSCGTLAAVLENKSKKLYGITAKHIFDEQNGSQMETRCEKEVVEALVSCVVTSEIHTHKPGCNRMCLSNSFFGIFDMVSEVAVDVAAVPLDSSLDTPIQIGIEEYNTLKIFQESQIIPNRPIKFIGATSGELQGFTLPFIDCDTYREGAFIGKDCFAVISESTDKDDRFINKGDSGSLVYDTPSAAISGQAYGILFYKQPDYQIDDTEELRPIGWCTRLNNCLKALNAKWDLGLNEDVIISPGEKYKQDYNSNSLDNEEKQPGCSSTCNIIESLQETASTAEQPLNNGNSNIEVANEKELLESTAVPQFDNFYWSDMDKPKEIDLSKNATESQKKDDPERVNVKARISYFDKTNNSQHSYKRTGSEVVYQRRNNRKPESIPYIPSPHETVCNKTEDNKESYQISVSQTTALLETREEKLNLVKPDVPADSVKVKDNISLFESKNRLNDSVSEKVVQTDVKKIEAGRYVPFTQKEESLGGGLHSCDEQKSESITDSTDSEDGTTAMENQVQKGQSATPSKSKELS